MAKTTEKTTEKKVLNTNTTDESKALVIANSYSGMNQASLAVFSKPMQSQFSKLLKATAGMNKNTWTFVDTVVKIVDEELYKDDFKTKLAFADFMHISAGALSQMIGASHYADMLKEGLTTEDGTVTKTDVRNSMSWSRAYLYSTLVNIKNAKAADIVKKLNDFSKFCNDENILVNNDAALKNAIKAYKNKGKEEKPAEKKPERTVVFVVNGTKYKMPVSVLAKYEYTENAESIEE